MSENKLANLVRENVFPCCLLLKKKNTYYFFKSSHSYLQMKRAGNGSISRSSGSVHGTDRAFLFDMTTFTRFFTGGVDLDLDTAEARAMTDVYRGTMTQFAKSGNPSRGASGGLPAVWPRFDLTSRDYMILSPTPRAGQRVYGKRISLWQDFLPKIQSSIFSRW